MKSFSQFLSEEDERIAYRVTNILGKDGMIIMGNNQRRINRSDIIGAFTTVNFGGRLVLRPDEFVKKLPKGCFQIYSVQTKSLSIVKIDENLKMHFPDHFKDDDETPVFNTNGVVIRELVAITKKDVKEYSNKELSYVDPTPSVSLDVFKKTEFGKLLF